MVAGMKYLDRIRPPRRSIPGVRSHIEVWRRFKNATGTWPIISITTYALRFILLVAGMAVIIWYGDVIHGWTRHQVGLALAALLAPVIYVWFIVERTAWNHDLRKAGLSSEQNVWSTDQFP
jgi:hypothetical protein